MKHVALETILQPGQEYIQEYIDRFQANIYGIRHDRPTITCFDKAELMQEEENLKEAEPYRVIKSIVRHKEGKFSIFVSPELGEKGKPSTFNDPNIKKIFNYNKNITKKFTGQEKAYYPLGMDKGSVTFLVPKHYFEGDGYTGTLEKIYFRDYPSIDNKIVDVAAGGYGEEALLNAVQGTYKTFYNLLKQTFPEKIEKIAFTLPGEKSPHLNRQSNHYTT